MKTHPYSFSSWRALLTALLLVLAGCVGSGETAVVTDRPTGPTEPPPAPRQVTGPTGETTVATSPFDTVQAGRFDKGKMWTFDNPPLAYFEETYDFSPDSAWFAHARLGALRFATYCSASFVSPSGLIMTNHHCARESITEVSRAGENLLDNGFYAETLEQERAVEDLYVEQLIEITDVTDQVSAALEGVEDDETRAQRLQTTIDRLEQRLTQEAQTGVQEAGDSVRVQVVELYNGGQYFAYTFRRYSDIRLVVAPGLQLAYFGGDADNFTYPRYALDFTFFRAYDKNGEPLRSEHYFPWHQEGSRVGDAVFAVGNPGSTSRLSTVSQLTFQRDVALPQQLDVLRSRAEILSSYIDAHPVEAEQHDVRNVLFSINNSIKALEGQLAGLRDPYLIARRQAAEQDLEQALAQNDSLQRRYGNVLEDLAALQRSKEAAAEQAGAFTGFGDPNQTSHLLLRGLYGYVYTLGRQRGAPADYLQELREEALNLQDWPRDLEAQYIAARLRELQRYLGENDPTLRSLLQGRSPEALADTLAAHSALADSSVFAHLLTEGNYLKSDDVSVPVMNALAPLYFTLGRQVSQFEVRERKLSAELARARFALFGTDVPPDATFSLRIADGVISGYPYNGTQAPAYTTFFGLYNHYYTYGPDSDWDLPPQWLSPPESFQLSTPLNLVSTNDITGGNSGSPLLNKDLEVVGLVFDSNIQALPNQYLYTDMQARAISVDVRGIQEALDDIYNADRIVQELVTGALVRAETEAEESIGDAR